MTNDRFVLHRDHLLPWLRRIKKEHRLVAPCRNRHGDTLFTVVADLDRATIDLDNQPQTSVKPFLFPQVETLFTYDRATCTYTPRNHARPTIYFGVRSCDLTAVLYMDVVFGSGRDPYYRHKRENALFISLACNQPFPDCFCLATRSGPAAESGYDLQLTDLGDRFLVEVGRARGRVLLERWPAFFTPAAEADDRDRYQAYLEARAGFQRSVPVAQAMARLREGRVDEAVFHKLSSRCQDCGGCAYVCPTCTCFSIVDQPRDGDHGVRLRTWDACTFAGFTRMAGGHNPVDQATAKIKKRFLHKLLHDPAKHRRPSCVGCGRCVGMCFGGVDIVRFIDLVCERNEP